jgi:hypothetical protein
MLVATPVYCLEVQLRQIDSPLVLPERNAMQLPLWFYIIYMHIYIRRVSSCGVVRAFT